MIMISLKPSCITRATEDLCKPIHVTRKWVIFFSPGLKYMKLITDHPSRPEPEQDPFMPNAVNLPMRFIRPPPGSRFRFILIIPMLVCALTWLGCAELQTLRVHTINQDKTIAGLKEENRQFRDAYYEIKQSLDDEVADHDKNLKLKNHALQQAKTFKTEQEKQLGDDLRALGLEYQAFQEDARELKLELELKLGKLERILQQVTAERDAGRQKMAEIQKKLETEKGHNAELTREKAKLKIEIQNRDDQIGNLQEDVAGRTEELEKVSLDLQSAGVEIQGLKEDLEKAKGHVSEMEDILATTDEELDLSRGEIKKLTEASSGTVELEKYRQAQSELKKLEAGVAELESSLDETGEELGNAEQRVQELKDGSHDLLQDDELAALRKKITEQLKSKSLELPVLVIHDRAGIRLILFSDDLFDKGTTVLAENASVTLTEIGGILSVAGNRLIMIEGHTDNEPVRDMPFPDNWRLGYARADSVRRYLMENQNISGQRIRTLSRADQAPIKDHSTPENRKKNRRVEIVIAHRLKQN
jgi:chemotaxis protein MotB